MAAGAETVWPLDAQVEWQQREWGMPDNPEGRQATREWMQYVGTNTKYCSGVQLKMQYDNRDGLLILQTDQEGIRQYNLNEFIRKQEGGMAAAVPDWFYWHAYWYEGLELLNVYDLRGTRECS